MKFKKISAIFVAINAIITIPEPGCPQAIPINPQPTSTTSKFQFIRSTIDKVAGDICAISISTVKFKPMKPTVAVNAERTASPTFNPKTKATHKIPLLPNPVNHWNPLFTASNMDFPPFFFHSVFLNCLPLKNLTHFFHGFFFTNS